MGQVEIKVGDRIVTIRETLRVVGVGLATVRLEDSLGNIRPESESALQGQLRLGNWQHIPAAKQQAESRPKDAADLISLGYEAGIPADIIAGWMPLPDDTPPPDCNHQPRTVTLLTSTVTECKFCGQLLE